MTIQLYNCDSDNRVVDKSAYLSEIGGEIECNVFHECSIMSPQFLLEYNAAYVNANYLVVPSWGRYYFIVDVTLAPGGRMYLTCAEDVLMSNAGDIKNLTAYCTRSESEHVQRLAVDQAMPSLTTTNVTNLNFSKSPFKKASIGGYSYLLTVKGGKIIGGD